MPDPIPLHPALVRYLSEVEAESAASRPSVFWQRELARRPFKVAGLSAEELDLRLRKSSYRFTDLRPEMAAPDDAPKLKAALQNIPRARELAKQVSPERLGMDSSQWEHLRALDFLQREGLLEDYLAFLRPLRVHSEAAVARHFHYARQIAGLARQTQGKRQLDVLEIGAGAGNLALFLTLMGLVRSYVVVDLPRMLLHSAYTIQARLRDAHLVFNEPPGGAGSYAFVADFRAAELLGNDAFDLCLNLNSFMEMDRAARDGYFGLIYRSGRPGALFYNVNRRQPALPLHDGGTWDNNPLLYPYRSDDDVLIWEDDPFQTVTRSGWSFRPTLALVRAALIRPYG